MLKDLKFHLKYETFMLVNFSNAEVDLPSQMPKSLQGRG